MTNRSYEEARLLMLGEFLMDPYHSFSAHDRRMEAASICNGGQKEIESLRAKSADYLTKLGIAMDHMGDYQDDARTLRARITTIEEALRPFAMLDIPDGDSGDMHWCLVGDVEIRRAAEVLKEIE